MKPSWTVPDRCHPGTIVACLAAMLFLAVAPAWAADIVLECPRVKVVLGEDAKCRSLIDKTTGVEWIAKGPQPFAHATINGKHHNAQRAILRGDQLQVTLQGETTLHYRVKTTDDWIALQLDRIEGPRPTRLTLVNLSVQSRAHDGSRLNVVWDDRGAVGLIATNLQTEVSHHSGRASSRQLTAFSQDEPGPKLEGSGAAVIAAPPAHLPGILRRLAAAYDLPRNEGPAGPSKELPIARRSYWFLNVGQKDVDKVVDYCQQSGIRQVLFNSGSWCAQVGHYTFRKDRYPDGLEGLRRTVARLHEHGILVGMHCFASKVSKTDAYVTPVPDRRFWVDRSDVLAADVGATETSIRVQGDLSQWPGSPVSKQKTWEGGVDKHQEVILDDEIIRYKSIGPEGRWDTFFDCQRGAWRTQPAMHKTGVACRHYGVDGCINGYIIDQETDLLDEATSRLAEIFNVCDFDMVYFDGGEDVPRTRFGYYVSKFQATAMRKFRKRPLIHMGTIMTHGLWHSFTRTATVDTYLNTLHGHLISGGKLDRWPTVREHIDTSVRHLVTAENDLLPGELGWFGIWPKGGPTDGLQLDEIEYLMVRSLSHDAPISLETSFAQMERHPLTPGILEIVRTYERLRGQQTPPIPVEQVAPGKDFLLLPQGSGPPARPRFIPVEPLARVAGSEDLRAMIGADGHDAVVSIWHCLGRDGRLTLDAPQATAQFVDGQSAAVTSAGASVSVPLGARRTVLRLPKKDLAAARELLLKAKWKTE